MASKAHECDFPMESCEICESLMAGKSVRREPKSLPGSTSIRCMKCNRFLLEIVASVYILRLPPCRGCGAANQVSNGVKA